MVPASLRRTTVWAEWGPVPFPLRRGLPRRAYLEAGERAALVMAISEGTRRSVTEVGVEDSKVVVVPNVLRTEEIRFSEEGRARVRGELGILEQAFVVFAGFLVFALVLLILVLVPGGASDGTVVLVIVAGLCWMIVAQLLWRHLVRPWLESGHPDSSPRFARP